MPGLDRGRIVRLVLLSVLSAAGCVRDPMAGRVWACDPGWQAAGHSDPCGSGCVCRSVGDGHAFRGICDCGGLPPAWADAFGDVGACGLDCAAVPPDAAGIPDACGTCPDGIDCDARACPDSGCVPDCSDRECGDDGCGGSCGMCPTGEACDGHVCVCTPRAGIGCVNDDLYWLDSCGVPADLYQDCDDGDVCTEDVCAGDACGHPAAPDGNDCGNGQWCRSGKCVCRPDCFDRNCGDDGCGGSCGGCPQTMSCDHGQCVCVPQHHRACDGSDVWWFDSCGQKSSLATGCDDGSVCTEDGCIGDSCTHSPASEFAVCGDGLWCIDGDCVCRPACAGRDCGDDGCGGTCGTCSGGKTCFDGLCTCADHAKTDCSDGDLYWFDACGTRQERFEDCVDMNPCTNDTCANAICVHKPALDGTSCLPGKWCQLGACVCQPACEGRDCGEDGCGGSCGECTGGQVCSDGACVCVPHEFRACVGAVSWWFDSCALQQELADDCEDDSVCTDDACLVGDCTYTPVEDGTFCGDGFWCQSGACVCRPDCAGKACGDDGCGGSCGGCATGLECDAGFCRTPLVVVPAGVFPMGCNLAVDDACLLDEKPYHAVGLAAYSVEQWKVSVAAYRAYLDAAGPECRNPGDQGSCLPSTGAACTWDVTGRELHPINCVTWFQADGYCRWAGRRLCTEAEWERAARGTTGLRFPWGNDCPATWGGSCTGAEWAADSAKANCLESYCRDEFLGTSAVGALPGAVAASGALEMVGNVSEWVADWYGSDYYCNGDAADTVEPWSYCPVVSSPPSSPWMEPTGPATGSVRVLRGAGYFGFPVSLRVAFRGFAAPSDPSDDIGFRCCKP